MFTPTMGQADPQEADGEGRQIGKTHKSRRLEEVGLRRRRLQGGAGQIARRRAQKGAQKGARKKGGSEGRVGKRGAGGRGVPAGKTEGAEKKNRAQGMPFRQRTYCIGVQMRGGAVRLKNLGARRATKSENICRPTQKKRERDADKARLGEKARAESRHESRAQAVHRRQEGDADEKEDFAIIHATCQSGKDDTMWTEPPKSSTRLIAQIVYGLHAVTIVTGIFTAASIVGMFLFSWPSILAVILNYVFRGDARNTYLESHFSWQIRTFWYAALFVGLTWLLSTPLLLVGVGFFVAVLGFGITGIWVGYRIFKGWLRLQDDEPMPD